MFSVCVCGRGVFVCVHTRMHHYLHNMRFFSNAENWLSVLSVILRAFTDVGESKDTQMEFRIVIAITGL